MLEAQALSMDALAEVRFIEGALRCVSSPTLNDAGRLGICLDLVANMRLLMAKWLLPSIEDVLIDHGPGDEVAWKALRCIDDLVERLPEADVEWIDTAVAQLKVYYG